jgi:hypothetical protein
LTIRVSLVESLLVCDSLSLIKGSLLFIVFMIKFLECRNLNFVEIFLFSLIKRSFVIKFVESFEFCLLSVTGGLEGLVIGGLLSQCRGGGGVFSLLHQVCCFLES